MRKIIHLIIFIFILFIFFSCPSEIVKKTSWEGTLDSNLGYSDIFNDKHDIEFFMRNNNTMKAIAELKTKDSGTWEYVFDGSYILNNDYTFQAELENEDGDIKLELEGVLNTTTSNGYGDCKWEWVDGEKNSGDWEVSKIY